MEKLKKLKFEKVSNDLNAIQQQISSVIQPNENEILNYLCKWQKCSTVALVNDFSGIENYFTDGEWAWFEDLIYYVGKYNYKISQEFHNHILTKIKEKPKKFFEINWQQFLNKNFEFEILNIDNIEVIKKNCFPFPQKDEQKILYYLSLWKKYFPSTLQIKDCFTNEKKGILCPHFDFGWSWDSDLIYYVGKYHYKINERFYKHIMKQIDVVFKHQKLFEVDWENKINQKNDILKSEFLPNNIEEIKNNIKPNADENESYILFYLSLWKRGQGFSKFYDLFTNEEIASLNYYTDGEWSWNSKLIYYIGKYHYQISNQFREYILTKILKHSEFNKCYNYNEWKKLL